MERSLYWYIGSLRILTNTYTIALTTKRVVSKVLFPECIFHYNLENDLNKENARITQVLKKNGYQESIISKRATNNHSLPQSQQQKQATDIEEDEIKISINLPYVGVLVKNSILCSLSTLKTLCVNYFAN